MKYVTPLVLLLGMLLLRTAHADTSPDFVRIACVPENGLLDVEARQLHDSVAGQPRAPSGPGTALSRAGFHRPDGLRFTCDLDGARYTISSEQGESSNAMCGGSPPMSLTVTRNGTVIFSDVMFGYSCLQRPSLMRFTIGDGAKSWRGRETLACYATGQDGDVDQCEWTSGSDAEFNKRFPVDQAAIGRIVNRNTRRPAN